MDSDAATRRLGAAAALDEILDAACDAFVVVLEAINGYQDRGGGFDSALVMAAAAAADGRDALLWAPSMAAAAGRREAARGDGLTAADVRACVTHIAEATEVRLREALTLATAGEDRAACSDGAACARRVADLTGGPAQ
jgi:hypothetical protein